MIPSAVRVLGARTARSCRGLGRQRRDLGVRHGDRDGDRDLRRFTATFAIGALGYLSAGVLGDRVARMHSRLQDKPVERAVEPPLVVSVSESVWCAGRSTGSSTKVPCGGGISMCTTLRSSSLPTTSVTAVDLLVEAVARLPAVRSTSRTGLSE